MADTSQHEGPSRGSKLKRRLLPLGVLGIAAVALTWWRAPQQTLATEGAPGAATRDLTSVSGAIFGTTWNVKVVGESPDSEGLASRLDGRLRRLDEVLSTYREDSALMWLNRAPKGEWVNLAPELHEVLTISKSVHRLSEGAFDPTVGRLVRAWGFGPDPRPSRAPDVAKLMSSVGFHHLELHPSDMKARWLRQGVDLDLSAVAKGYAVDQLSQLLDSEGLTRHMVEIGGEVRTHGAGPTGDAWRIGVETPDARPKREAAVAVSLHDRAMATSGDYRNFYQVDGDVVSHTIDPVTGSPVTHDLGSVTVISTTAAEADAWATALNVLGPVRGEAIASRAGLDYMMIVRTGDAFRQVLSPGFSAMAD